MTHKYIYIYVCLSYTCIVFLLCLLNMYWLLSKWRPSSCKRCQLNGSSVKSVVFTYTPSKVTLTVGQHTEIRPALFGPSATRRFSALSRLPEGLMLDGQTGSISGVPVKGSGWETFSVQVEMADGQCALGLK